MAKLLTTMVIKLANGNNPLLPKLISKQGHRSDYSFAKVLGISRPLWQLTRTGKLQIGLTLLKAIAHTYPDMHPDIIEFLKDSTGERL